MLRILLAVPKLTVTALIILAIVNLLVGVILRYFVGAINQLARCRPRAIYLG